MYSKKKGGIMLLSRTSKVTREKGKFFLKEFISYSYASIFFFFWEQNVFVLVFFTVSFLSFSLPAKEELQWNSSQLRYRQTMLRKGKKWRNAIKSKCNRKLVVQVFYLPPLIRKWAEKILRLICCKEKRKKKSKCKHLTLVSI